MKSLTKAWLDAAKNDLDVIDRIVDEGNSTCLPSEVLAAEKNMGSVRFLLVSYETGVLS